MKLIVFIVCLSLVSVAVFALDLSAIARKERARREAIRSASQRAPAYTNADLESYGAPRDSESSSAPVVRRGSRSEATRRDLAKEEAYWRKEREQLERELARLDAGIRRLEWRLSEREARQRGKSRLVEDPTVAMIEQSLETLREARRKAESDFIDRARKAGAFPGWLR